MTTARKRKRKKSAKRVRRGKALAKALPRDEKGRFLPAGSKNRFRKRSRRKSVPAKRTTKKRRKARRRSAPTTTTMARRRGGIKDQFPNFMSGRITQSDANNFVTAQVNTPIPRLKTQGGKATVMELLWVDIRASNFDLTAAGDNFQFQMTLGTVQAGILGWNDTRVFVFKSIHQEGGASGLSIFEQTLRYSFQDNMGFGYLLAADSFRTSGDSGGQATALQFDWKLFYRFVDIPLSEFIGIVQSTQTI